MALQTYNSAKHHIGLGPVGGADYGFIISGGYSRSAQRLGSPAEFGGERDLVTPSVLSRWTQQDFSGGIYKEFWGDDPAMFWYSKGILPSLLDRSVRTVPPMVWWGPAGKADASDALAVFASGAHVNVVKPTATQHYNVSTGAITSTTNTATDEVLAAAHDPNDNYIYAICEDGSARRLKRYKQGVAVATIDTFPGPAPNVVHGMEMSGKDIVCSLGGVFYLVDIADDRSEADFTRVGRLGGGWKDSVPYNGLVYILITDGEQTTRLIQWDGQSLLAVTEWPYNFIGDCITSYGGRLFVGGSGRDVTGSAQYAELYEVTGSSLRLVRSFADEARAGRSVPTRIFDMVAHEGLLFCGTNKHYLIAYDLTRDSLFHGPEIIPDPSSKSVTTKFLLSTHQKLFAWCDDLTGSGSSSGDGFYRLATAAGDFSDPTQSGATGTNVTAYNCIVETSDFAPEPDRDKRWAQLRVLTRLSESGAAPVTARYSIDGGISYSSLTPVAVTNGSFTTTTFDLGAVALSKQIRFEFTFAKTNVVKYTELLAFTTTFLMTDENRSVWTFTIANVDQPETKDRVTETHDLDATDSQLWTWWAEKTPLDFTDLVGDVHRVLISDIGDNKPIIGDSTATGKEGFYTVVLTEF